MDKIEIQKYIGRIDYSIERVMKQFNTYDSRILFLADNEEKLVGSITDGDIKRYLVAGGDTQDNAVSAANKSFRVAGSYSEAKYLYDKENYIVIPIVNSYGMIEDFYDGSDEEKSILLLGGGGHCRSVLDCILSKRSYSKVGIIDFDQSSVSGVRVVGTDDDLPQLKTEGWTDAFVTVGSIGNTVIRRKLYEMVKAIGFNIPTIVDSTAIIARKVRVGEGSFIGKRTVINAGSWIGSCTIVNTGSIIEHDCIIGDFTHVSPGTTLCGQVSIGDDSHIGAGTTVIQQIHIGKQTVIGAGSVVVRDIPDGVKAFGNPCRVVE